MHWRGQGHNWLSNCQNQLLLKIMYKHLLQSVSSHYHNCKIQSFRLWATSLVHTFPEQPLQYHNYIPQGINIQYYPFLDNLKDITFQNFSEFLWATIMVLCPPWATRILLFKGWTTKMFIILYEQPPIFSLKFFSKLEMC